MEEFREGQLVKYKWSKNGKWYDGRIAKIEFIPGWKANYKIETFKKAEVLDWSTILKGIERGIDRNFIDTEGKDVWVEKEDWFFVKWFSKDYIKSI